MTKIIGGWRCSGALEGDKQQPVHIVPHEDLFEHIHNEGCWCKPKADHGDKDLFVHHSLDGREYGKTANRSLH